MDHHKNLFGTNKATPFVKNKIGDWQTSNGGSYNEGAFNASPIKGAGSATFSQPDAYKMQFMSQSQRDTGV